MLRDNVARVPRVICVVDREKGATELLKKNRIELVSLVKISDFKDVIDFTDG
jgi:orotate phosphoribosyltransferase